MLNAPIRSEWSPSCVAAHAGVWCIEPARMHALSRLVLAGGNPRPEHAAERQETPEEREARRVAEMYALTEDGVAVVTLDGPMQKFDSKFGGVNTLRAKRVIRSARDDDRVGGIMLLIDSPGGSADGTLELAEEVAAAGRVKPVATRVSGMMASAALWVGVQAGRVSSGPADMTGSIGTYAAVEDWSKWYADRGVTVEVIAAGGEDDGGVKGAGVDGVPVTDAYRQDIRRIVNGLNDLFVAGVAAGRGMTEAQARALADGRVHLGAGALALGMIDAVEDDGAAMEHLRGRIAAAGRAPGGRSTRRARLELDRAGVR